MTPDELSKIEAQVNAYHGELTLTEAYWKQEIVRLCQALREAWERERTFLAPCFCCPETAAKAYCPAHDPEQVRADLSALREMIETAAQGTTQGTPHAYYLIPVGRWEAALLRLVRGEGA